MPGRAVRCYFMKNGHIFGVEFLGKGDAESLIAEAKRLFEQKGAERWADGFEVPDGFEVWNGARFLYRYPEDAQET